MQNKTKKQPEKNCLCSGKKNLTETPPEEAQTLELLVKKIKSTVLN